MSNESDNINVEVSESVASQQAADKVEAKQEVAEVTSEPENSDDAADGDGAGDDAQESDEQQSEAGDDDVPYGVKKKLGKLTARVYERDEKIRERDAEIENLRKQISQRAPDPVKAAQDEEKPTLESCDFNQDDYIQKSIEWGINQREKRQVEAAHQHKALEMAQERERAFADRSKSFEAEHPDYRKVAFSESIRVTPEMAEAIKELDEGPAIAYYLGKNPEEASRIATLTPASQAVALAKLGRQFDSEPIESDDDAAPVQRKITSAPPPVRTLNPSAPVKKALADLPMNEYVREREKARANKSSRGFL